MTYEKLVKAFKVKCPICDGRLKLQADLKILKWQFKGDERELSPLLKCTNSKCGATFRPEIILHRSLENVKINIEISNE